MGDIVNDLRAWPARSDGSDGMSSHTVGGIMEAAASEIEQLRSEVAELRHVVAMAKLPADLPLASRAFPNPFKVII